MPKSNFLARFPAGAFLLSVTSSPQQKQAEYAHLPLTLSSTSLVAHFQQFMDHQWQKKQAKIMKECNESSWSPRLDFLLTSL